MSPHSTPTTTFANWSAIFAQFEIGRIPQCLSKCGILLAAPSLTSHLRQTTLCLVAICVASDTEDWERSETFRLQAEEIWSEVRRGCPVGGDTEVDSALMRLRTALDELSKAQVEKKEKQEREKKEIGGGEKGGGSQAETGGKKLESEDLRDGVGVKDELEILIDELMEQYGSWNISKEASRDDE